MLLVSNYLQITTHMYWTGRHVAGKLVITTAKNAFFDVFHVSVLIGKTNGIG